MKRSFLLITLFYLLFINTSLSVQGKALAQDKPAKSPWTIDDIVLSEGASDMRISPDSNYVAWIKTTPDLEKSEHASNLMLYNLKTKQEIELTRGTDKCYKPVWSPDGKLIAFTFTRPAKADKANDDSEERSAQIWLINPLGGEAWPITDYVRNLNQVEWANNETIIFSAQENESLYETNIKTDKDTSILVEDEKHEPPVRLFSLNIKSKKIMHLTNNSDRIQHFSLSPDGTRAFAIHDRSLRFIYDNSEKPIYRLWNLNTGESKQYLNENRFNLLQSQWALKENGLYFANATTSDPKYVIAAIIEIFYLDLDSDQVTKVDLGWPNGIYEGNDEIGAFSVTEHGFITLLSKGVNNVLASYKREGKGWKRNTLAGEHIDHIVGCEASNDGQTVIYDHSNATRPTQIYCARIVGSKLSNVLQITDLNTNFQNKDITKVEIVHWPGALDEEVEGLLYYPKDYQPGKKYPLIVMIHGGPMLADIDEWWETWSSPKTLICQRGAFVFKPNYHGSANYGLKWLESISKGKYYDLEVPDIEKGVDYLIGRGLIDADKMGLMGWSNGAILSIALTVATTRYKVASIVAGDVEHVSDWAASEFGAAFDEFYFGASPLQDPQLYYRKSPFYQLSKVRTPTLIFHGTEDRAVFPQQGWLHYRALQQLGNTDVKFILFPGEKHGPEKLAHQKRKLQEEMAWLDKYLFNTFKPSNEAFKSDSLLAAKLRLKAAKHEGKFYGERKNDNLIPEVVKYEDLELGRFEVTRAQFHEFDKNYLVEVGTENYPANNISFDQAQAYCVWLNKLTGETYHLGTEDEMEEIYQTSATQENTLDYWAGYAVNIDDANKLKDKLMELGNSAPLLKEVGSFYGVGEEDLVFDLGGNVNEWVIDEKGKGIIMGGSADMANDIRARSTPSSNVYTGFRVVKSNSEKSNKDKNKGNDRKSGSRNKRSRK